MFMPLIFDSPPILNVQIFHVMSVIFRTTLKKSRHPKERFIMVGHQIWVIRYVLAINYTPQEESDVVFDLKGNHSKAIKRRLVIRPHILYSSKIMISWLLLQEEYYCCFYVPTYLVFVSNKHSYIFRSNYLYLKFCPTCGLGLVECGVARSEIILSK